MSPFWLCVLWGFLLFFAFTLWLSYHREMMIRWIANEWYLSSSGTERGNVTALGLLKHHPEVITTEIDLNFKKLLRKYTGDITMFPLRILVLDQNACVEEIVIYLQNVLLRGNSEKIGPAPE